MEQFYEFIPTGGGAYRVTSAEKVCCDLFIGERAALLYDTGYGFGDLCRAVREMTALPLTVVLSHGHLDHSAGAFRFAGCPIRMHEAENPTFERHNGRDVRQRSAENFRGPKPADFSVADYAAAALPEIRPVDEGERFDLGGLTLDTLHFSGHTPGGVALWHRETRTLYFGDAINPSVWLFLPESVSLDTHIASLTRAQALDFDRFYVSHAHGVMDRSRIADFLDAAKTADYDKGFPLRDGRIAESMGARICPRAGYLPNEFNRAGFAAVVIGPPPG